MAVTPGLTRGGRSEVQRTPIVAGTFPAKAPTERTLATVPSPVSPRLINDAVLVNAMTNQESMGRELNLARGALKQSSRHYFRARKGGCEGENFGSRL